MTNPTRRQTLRLAAAAALGLPLIAHKAYAASHATTHTVRITNFTFEPAALTIAPGDQVEFINEDGAPHTATDDNGAFDTGRLSRGQKAVLTFPSAGTFSYFCAIHPRMKGSITVA